MQAHLSPDCADLLELAYYSGWRRGEIVQLTWDAIDQDAAVVRLRPELSKNSAPGTPVIASASPAD